MPKIRLRSGFVVPARPEDQAIRIEIEHFGVGHVEATVKDAGKKETKLLFSGYHECLKHMRQVYGRGRKIRWQPPLTKSKHEG